MTADCDSPTFLPHFHTFLPLAQARWSVPKEQMHSQTGRASHLDVPLGAVMVRLTASPPATSFMLPIYFVLIPCGGFVGAMVRLVGPSIRLLLATQLRTIAGPDCNPLVRVLGGHFVASPATSTSQARALCTGRCCSGPPSSAGPFYSGSLVGVVGTQQAGPCSLTVGIHLHRAARAGVRALMPVQSHDKERWPIATALMLKWLSTRGPKPQYRGGKIKTPS